MEWVKHLGKINSPLINGGDILHPRKGCGRFSKPFGCASPIGDPGRGVSYHGCRESERMDGYVLSWRRYTRYWWDKKAVEPVFHLNLLTGFFSGRLR